MGFSDAFHLVTLVVGDVLICCSETRSTIHQYIICSKSAFAPFKCARHLSCMRFTLLCGSACSTEAFPWSERALRLHMRSLSGD